MFQLYVNNISSLYMEILRSFDILLLQPRAFNYSRPFVRNQVLILSSFCVNFIFGSQNTSFFICPSVITVGLLITEHCFSEHFFYIYIPPQIIQLNYAQTPTGNLYKLCLWIQQHPLAAATKVQ